MALSDPKKSESQALAIVVVVGAYPTHLFVCQHWIDNITVTVDSRLELVVDDDRLLPWMGFQHSSLEAPEEKK